ncbi:pseudouridine synthase [Myceligenerans pegani]|uniref:Pseudouridine synthase n=1 Tax=Myceligenerans pegani TaxID=2776917 RepID=A0ABR9N5L3_9MICO|nr:pseudouridine synthase [Myceligenerans sp. TRM 65318]MBE1878938.1 rRNA pseudouridine synthase [Myceligenerans sp. TRM 65318]MBE3021209.1 rRNA pseudouridine synthase [Myceligenerans sp. TRM 65318]
MNQHSRGGSRRNTENRAAANRAGQGRGQGRRQPARRRVPSAEPPRDVHVADGVRLQKVLAQAGFGSRRACEELIERGHVEVDGVLVTELGVRVDPATAVIHVDGLRVQLDQDKITLALHKPHGVVSTMHDPQGRPTVAELIKDREERLFHVGRLDADSEGLLLLTNDGELANRLSHPKYQIPKTYVVTVEGGPIYPRIVKDLTRGVELDDGPARLDSVKVLQEVTDATLLEVVLHEGRNRIVRRMFDAVERPVTRLVRTRVGPIRLGDLKPGRTRVLGRVELGQLMSDVDL